MYTLKNVTLWQRIQLDLCLPRTGSFEDAAMYLALFEILELSETEKELIKFETKTIGTPSGKVQIPDWDDDLMKKHGHLPTRDLVFESADFIKMRKLAQDRGTWPTLLRETLELKKKMDDAKEWKAEDKKNTTAN